MAEKESRLYADARAEEVRAERSRCVLYGCPGCAAIAPSPDSFMHNGVCPARPGWTVAVPRSFHEARVETIRSQLCQELAEALRARVKDLDRDEESHNSPGAPAFVNGVASAAEFVERFGNGGENG